MWVLATRPDLLARLKANPADIALFVEEAIRWAMHFFLHDGGKTFRTQVTSQTCGYALLQ